jgi:hypothetical protein
MSLWYSTLSMGSFIDGDGNIIRWKHIEELQNVEEQEGLYLANKLSSNHIQFQLLCCRCDWASCIFNKFSKVTYLFTTLQCHSESLIHVVCVHIQFERKNFSFPRFTDRIHVWKVMIRIVLNENITDYLHNKKSAFFFKTFSITCCYNACWLAVAVLRLFFAVLRLFYRHACLEVKSGFRQVWACSVKVAFHIF